MQWIDELRQAQFSARLIRFRGEDLGKGSIADHSDTTRENSLDERLNNPFPLSAIRCCRPPSARVAPGFIRLLLQLRHNYGT